jgi:hypothetical protein
MKGNYVYEIVKNAFRYRGRNSPVECWVLSSFLCLAIHPTTQPSTVALAFVYLYTPDDGLRTETCSVI